MWWVARPTKMRSSSTDSRGKVACGSKLGIAAPIGVEPGILELT